MSTQRPVSSTRAASSPGRLIAALILGAALGAGATLLMERGGSDASRRVTLQSKAPAGSLLAFVAEQPCASRVCQHLYLGQSASDGVALDALDTQAVSEIAWTPDGKRAGFVIDGRELWLYDTATRKLAGRIGLMPADAAQSRLARGITFSENGRAVTFDDCPRTHSGCRAGVVGVPQ